MAQVEFRNGKFRRSAMRTVYTHNFALGCVAGRRLVPVETPTLRTNGGSLTHQLFR